jgi:hypothetical protein
VDLHEALKEVLEAASQPKQYPPGVSPVELSIDAFDTQDVKRRAWHESLTPAQETVCRWVWETCAQHYEPWEQFEVGFLYDFNTSHELAVWVRIASVFAEFLRRHPSVNKRRVISDLCRLSAGSRLTEFKGSRAKELTELWQQGMGFSFRRRGS